MGYTYWKDKNCLCMLSVCTALHFTGFTGCSIFLSVYVVFFLLRSQLCVLTLILCPFYPRVTAVARKRPRSFCQKCRWQVTPNHAYTFDPTKSECADSAAVQAWCVNQSGNELTRNSAGNTRSQSSQLAEPPWTDPGRISVRELISN